MHITLTDHLTCPRCGPSAGLILLMEQAAGRRVVTGSLGCPSCRTQYPIRRGVCEFAQGQGQGHGTGTGTGTGTAGAGLRVAALMELGEGSGFVVLDGPLALRVAEELRAHAPDIEPVVVLRSERGAEVEGVEASALLVSGPLPIGDRVMRGAAYVGGAPGPERLAELMRVTRPTGRVVVEGAPERGLDAAAAQLEAAGASVRARDAEGLVAVLF